jgi:hypothetical protein
VIHVLTIHWRDDRWVDIQLTYLHRHIQEPFKVYAFLNELPQVHRAKYFYSSTEPIEDHAIKLNILADIAAFNAIDSEDLLVFLDGDAFPIGDVISFGREKLNRYPLIAVQRRENGGDVQPHPCFCLTTVGFWKTINGDWKAGYQWKNSQGNLITDVGGNLLGIFREKGIEWYPMLRSNKKNLHPLLFGLYEDLVYHHGAAFRKPSTTIDRVKITRARAGRYRLKNWLPDTGLLLRVKAMFVPMRKIVEENRRLSQRIYEMIREDPFFYRYFQQSGDFTADI